MGVLTNDLAWMYAKGAFGAQRLTSSYGVAYGYFDQEEQLESDRSGNLLIKRTVFRMKTPLPDTPLASLDRDTAVAIFDPETELTTQYVVSETELEGDGRETRLILRAVA